MDKINNISKSFTQGLDKAQAAATKEISGIFKGLKVTVMKTTNAISPLNRFKSKQTVQGPLASMVSNYEARYKDVGAFFNTQDKNKLKQLKHNYDGFIFRSKFLAQKAKVYDSQQMNTIIEEMTKFENQFISDCRKIVNS